MLWWDIVNVPGSLDETDHATNNSIYLTISILPRGINNILGLMFLKLPNNCSELFDHELDVKAVVFIWFLFFIGWFFAFSFSISFRNILFFHCLKIHIGSIIREFDPSSFCEFFSVSDVDIGSSLSGSDGPFGRIFVWLWIF